MTTRPTAGFALTIEPVQAAPVCIITAPSVGADSAWRSGWDGAGIGIAVIDSGIAAHPDLQDAFGLSRVVYRQNFVDNQAGDPYGHGTHVAGILAGNGKSSLGRSFTRTFMGIAPKANLIDLRVLDANGASTDSMVIAAIERAIALKSRYNIRVINLSLGRPIYESYTLDPLCNAVEAAWKKGIVVVVAAGNLGRNGYASVLAPGNDPLVITVGAMKNMGTLTRSDDNIASYSSKGPSYIDLVAKPDLVAPANLSASLLAPNSTLAASYPDNIVPVAYYSTDPRTSPAYFRLSGTSMAAPVVSGAVALMLDKDPSLSPDTVKARLMKTASKSFPLYSTATDPTTGQTYVSAYDLYTVGAGYIDIAAALASADVANGSAASPSIHYDSASGNGYLSYSRVSGVSAPIWGATAVWGTTAVWGSSVFNLGATTAVWGTAAVWGTTAVWGTGGVSGSAAVWGTNSPGKGEQ